MRLRDLAGISDRNQARLSRAMQFLLLGAVFLGFYLQSPGIVVNSLVGLLITFLPGILERDYEITMDPALVLWITTAVFLHAAGTLGPYRNVWWWDHMTHALSSSVVAAAGYAAMRAFDEHREDIYLPPRLFFAFILIFVAAFGVLWELLEFGLSGLAEFFKSGSVLTQYGLEDTMNDLLFDLIGGIFVAVTGEIYLTGLVEEIRVKVFRRRSAWKGFRPRYLSRPSRP